MARDDALTVTGLTAGYRGARAISDISISVGAGEVVALLGANGAGKSTTLRVLSGLHPAESGRWTLLGTDVTGARADVLARRGLAHVPEGRQLFPQMSVRENLEVGMLRRSNARRVDIAPALDLFPELRPLVGRLAYSLSGGEQQMVAIARALLPGPEVILLDEPSLGLAPVVVDRIIETIAGMRAAGRSVLLVEQDTEVALACCDRGYVMADGRLVFEGDAERLRTGSDLTAAYLGEAAPPPTRRDD